MLEFLLNPNVAYLFIVVGFLLTVFAILAPGTGLPELGAAFALLFVGWQIYNIPINPWALVVLVLSIVPFIFALRHRRTTLNLVLTALAFVVGSVFLFREGSWYRPAVNPVLAIVVSLLGGGFFYMSANKSLEARSRPPTHDLGSLIGAVGEARTDVHIEGSVYVRGEMWTAFSDKKIKSGSPVKVLERQGLMLKVEQTDE